MLDLILLSGSKISRIEGKRLYQNKLVSDIKGKKIESIYHIYGKVKDEKIDDTILDLANYCLLWLVERKYRNQ